MNDLVILIVHYNRFELLKKTLNSLKKAFSDKVDYLITDDSSPPSVIKKLNTLNIDFVKNIRNKGTGGNTNNGLLTIDNKFILQIQDDFELKCDKELKILHSMIDIMKNNQDIDILRFYGTPKGLKVKEKRDYKGLSILIYDNNTILNYPYSFHLYSDTPHLKRSTFHKDYGLYKEYTKMEWTETEFAMRCLENKVTIASVEQMNDIFIHNGEKVSFRKKNNAQKSNSIYLQCLMMLFAYIIYRLTRVFPKILYN